MGASVQIDVSPSDSDIYILQFNECFKFFQPGGPGVITKLEMRIFVKKIAGLDTKDDEAADKLEKAAAMGNEET